MNYKGFTFLQNSVYVHADPHDVILHIDLFTIGDEVMC